jgi:outer membrane protein TolC
MKRVPNPSQQPRSDAPAPARPGTERTRGPAWLALGLALAAGCRSRAEYREAADEDVYAIVAERRAQLSETPDAFTIEPPHDGLRAQLLEQPEAELELDLLECLQVAAESSRSFQDRREALYLTALDLTLARYQFSTQSAGVLAGTVFDPGSNPDTADLGADLGLTRLLGSGARIIGNIGFSLVRSLSSGDSWDAVSNLSLSITQPLLRGSGSAVVLEPLTQAERDVLYEVRTYERFRSTFAVSVAEQVYRALQQSDTLRNEQSNYDNLVLLRERNEALSEAGRLSDIQVDQARQDELRAKSRVIESRARLDAQLDDLKFLLGLPVEARIALDPDDLARLQALGAQPVAIDELRAIDWALERRLDHLTVLDRVIDTSRAVEIAADNLRAGLGLVLLADADSLEGKPLDFRAEEVDLQATLSLDLPLDRLVERNQGRAATIALQSRERAAEASADAIASDLRERLRTLATSAEDYGIQLNSVTLAERRIESTRLNFEAGRAETRDLLEAQESLVTAQNSATQALIDYELARLALLRDLEALRIDESGFATDPAALELLAGA